MKTLYIVSTESFSGKTSLCYGIAARMKRDGRRVGYFKPLVFFGRILTMPNMAPSLSTTVSARNPKLLDRVRDVIRRKHYSFRTEQTYTDWIRRFIFFHGVKHPPRVR